MATPRIYCNQPLTLNSEFALPETAAHHVARVLRMKANDHLQLFNGNGQLYAATIIVIHKAQVTVTIHAANNVSCESNLKIHLGQVLTRTEKMDWIIQKAVELGVHAITPLWSQHCAVNYSAQQLAKKMQHWHNIIISACEQCGRNQLPILNTAKSLTEWLKLSHAYGILLTPSATKPLTTLLPSGTNISLLIGPEGGWHQQETTAAIAHDFHSVQLGPRVLRMETAAIVAIGNLQLLWGDHNA